MTPQPTRRDPAVAVLLGLIAFAVFAAGAAPTIYVGDSGELVAAVHTLGIPHPSGYPLYVLAGKLWTLAVPLGSVAYRMSLLSAAAGGGAVATLYLMERMAGIRPLASATGALVLAFSSSFWGESNIQRVYTLNALFFVSAFALAARWHARPHRRSLETAFFVCGLGAANHTFMALVAAPLALIGWLGGNDAKIPPRARLGIMLRGAAAFSLGLLPYAYLPLRSLRDPPLDWGDPETPAALWRVVTRADFWPRAWIQSPADVVAIVTDWLTSVPQEVGWAGAVLALAGVFFGNVPSILRVSLLAAAALNVAAVAVHGSRSDIFIWHRYYIPSYAVVAVFLAAGADSLLRRLPGRGGLVVLALPIALWIGGRGEFDRSRYRIAEDFAGRVLASLPPGASLIASDDNILFALLYLHLVEGRRADVHLVLQGVGKAHLPPLSFDPGEDTLFFTHHPNWTLREIEIVPSGLVFRPQRAGSRRPDFAVDARPLDGEDDPRVPKDYLTRNLIGHFHYMIGITLLEIDWPRAAVELSRAGEIASDNDVLFYNLGLVYLRSGLYEEAEAAFARSASINPRAIAGEEGARAVDRLSEVRAERQRIGQMERELQNILRATPDGDRLRTSTSAYHSALAGLLADRGEHRAALGRRLRAWASSD